MQYNILQHYNKRLNGGCSMGFFANAAGNTAQVEYASAKKKGYIACKDGRIHALAKLLDLTKSLLPRLKTYLRVCTLMVMKLLTSNSSSHLIYSAHLV